MTEEALKVTDQRRAELEEIRAASGGTLNPEDVIAYAQDKETALHSAFEWDDSEAAHQHRLWQARQIIRVCVTLRSEIDNQPFRTYVSLTEDRGETGYRLLDDVLTDTEMRQRLLDQALRELTAWQRKYEHLTALAPIFEAAGKVKQRRARTKANGRKTGGSSTKPRKVRVAAAMA
jgi:hypothetical protein